MSKKSRRCKLIVDGIRCNLDATHRLYDETGNRVKGAVYCEEHARQVVEANSQATDWNFIALPLKNATTAARIAELEAACEAALDWYGPDGDHISDPQRSQLQQVLGKPNDSMSDYWLCPRIPITGLPWRSGLNYENNSDDW